jgi:AhpD family alkylhydroperoxidase
MSDTKPRIGWQEFQKIAPDAYAALTKLSMAIGASGLDLGLVELLKLRASQINGCAFCTQYHLNAARKHGVAAEKLDLLVVWRESGIFTAREQAALAWTEKLTLVAGNHISDEDFAAVTAEFSTDEVAWLTAAIGLINTWNRIAGPLRFPPPIPKPEKELAHA